MKRRTTRSLALLLLVGMASAVDAAPKPERINASGKVFGVRRGAMAVVTTDNQQWIFEITEKTFVQVTGEAGPEALRPGMFVRFHANVDKQGKTHGEVKELTVFSPTDGFTPGAILDQQAPIAGGDPPAGAEADDAPQVDPADDADTPQDDPFAAPKKPEIQTQRYFISGQLRPGRKGAMIVLAGQHGAVPITVAADAKVSFDTADYSIVRQGDDVTIDATYTRAGKGTARRVEVQMAPRAVPQADPKQPAGNANQPAGGNADPFGVKPAQD